MDGGGRGNTAPGDVWRAISRPVSRRRAADTDCRHGPRTWIADTDCEHGLRTRTTNYGHGTQTTDTEHEPRTRNTNHGHGTRTTDTEHEPRTRNTNHGHGTRTTDTDHGHGPWGFVSHKPLKATLSKDRETDKGSDYSLHSQLPPQRDRLCSDIQSLSSVSAVRPTADHCHPASPVNGGQWRPMEGNGGHGNQRRPSKANGGHRRPMEATAGQWKPPLANGGLGSLPPPLFSATSSALSDRSIGASGG